MTTRLPNPSVDRDWGRKLNRALSEAFNVCGYGAKGDGATDDTAAIQAAINACQAAGGGIVFFPAGHYWVSSTLTVTGSNVTLVGSGGGINHDVASPANTSAATEINWVGGGGSPVVSFSAPTAAATATQTGGGVLGMMINCNAVATYGIQVVSWFNGYFRDVFIAEATVSSVLVTCSVGGDGEPRDSQQNLFSNVAARQMLGGSFIRLDGTAAANASMNLFENCNALVGTALTNVGAIALYNCDNNVFTRCRVSNAIPGDAVVFHAGASGWAGDNSFIAFSGSPTGAIKMKGTEEAANPSSNNTMLLLDSGNSTSTPTLGTGASGWWTFTNGTGRARNVGMVIADSVGDADAGLAARASTNSLLVVNSSGDAVRLREGTIEWGIAISGGNLRLVALGGATGVIELAADVKFDARAGFNGNAVTNKPTVTGSKGGNAALASLLTALASYGLITDSST